MVKTGDRVRVADNKNTRMMHEVMPEYYPEPAARHGRWAGPHQQQILGQVGQPPGCAPLGFPRALARSGGGRASRHHRNRKDHRDKKRTRVEVDGECGEVLRALAFATASAIHNSASTDDGRNFLMGYFKPR